MRSEQIITEPLKIYPFLSSTFPTEFFNVSSLVVLSEGASNQAREEGFRTTEIKSMVIHYLYHTITSADGAQFSEQLVGHIFSPELIVFFLEFNSEFNYARSRSSIGNQSKTILFSRYHTGKSVLWPKLLIEYWQHTAANGLRGNCLPCLAIQEPLVDGWAGNKTPRTVICITPALGQGCCNWSLSIGCTWNIHVYVHYSTEVLGYPDHKICKSIIWNIR